MLKKPRPCKTCGVMQSDGYKYCRPCAALSVVELRRYHADPRKRKTSVEQKPKTHACPRCGASGVFGFVSRCCDPCRLQMRKEKNSRVREKMKLDPIRMAKIREYARQRNKREQQQRLIEYWSASQARANNYKGYSSDAWRSKRKERLAISSDGTISHEWCRQFYAAHKACLYCGRAVDRRGLVMDHMQPIALGGLHSITNIAPSCHECNAAKGALPLSEWLDSMPQANAVRVHYWLHTRNCAAVVASPQPIVVLRINPAQACKDAMKAWREWLATAPAWWLDAYWSAHPKPWTRPGLTAAERRKMRYQLDEQYRWYHKFGKPSRATERRYPSADATHKRKPYSIERVLGPPNARA